MKKIILLALAIMPFGLLFGQKLNAEDFSAALTGKYYEILRWKISEIETRELTENGPKGNLKPVEPNENNIGHFMANSGLPDSIVFEKDFQFDTGLFTAKFHHSSSNDSHSYVILPGLWQISKNQMKWSCPNYAYLDNAVIEESGNDFFVLKGEVSYGSDAFEYFEYRVTYRLEKNEK